MGQFPGKYQQVSRMQLATQLSWHLQRTTPLSDDMKTGRPQFMFINLPLPAHFGIVIDPDLHL